MRFNRSAFPSSRLHSQDSLFNEIRMLVRSVRICGRLPLASALERNCDSTSMSRKVVATLARTGRNGRGSSVRRKTKPTQNKSAFLSYFSFDIAVGRVRM